MLESQFCGRVYVGRLVQLTVVVALRSVLGAEDERATLIADYF